MTLAGVCARSRNVATPSQILDHCLTRLVLLESSLYSCPGRCGSNVERQLERLRRQIIRARGEVLALEQACPIDRRTDEPTCP